MVGIIIVSHSVKVAEGIKEIAEQMGKGIVPIVAAGGTDENEIGTSPLKIQAAIESVYSEDGVLLFVDLGSAMMSSEMAIELLDESMQKKVEIVDAPILEGVIAATIQATIVSDIDKIKETAIGAKKMTKR